jgi:hypothetical protein
LASREKGRKGIDRTVACNEGRGRKALSDEDEEKGELLRSCEGYGGGTSEGVAGAEFFSESEIEG